MAKSKYTEQHITDTLELNYMPYAMSVIVSRAIPEIDGFKPAHRKLLYTMYKMGLLNGQRTKSTNVVGQTMKLNPHGDQTIYETMVRLTRGNDALLHPFIDSKGNFGKVFSSAMAYAASRYTEVKLDSVCSEIFKDIDKNTVDFVDNYDGTLKEPVLFPTTFPNVLVTPNKGIAVGMASTICSFNLREVCEAAIQYIKNSDIDLREYLKGPDFTTGGELIYNAGDMAKIYETGKGSFKIRAKYNYDKKNGIIEIYEIPYTTSIEAIIDKIIDLVKQNKIKEINDVRNETDLNGLKIAIDIKRSADPEKLMTKLYQMTPLTDSFSCNFNILVNGSPKTMGIKEILNEWIDFRMSCIKRQTAYDLEKKGERLHLLEGLEKILLDIDKAIKIIRETEEDSLVIPNLMEGFGIDRVQAEFVAEIKLRNLNKEYILRQTRAIEDLKKEIAELDDILHHESKVLKIIIADLKRVSKKYGRDRKTDIIYEHEIKQVDVDDFIEDYAVTLFLTKENYLKKITQVSLQASMRVSAEHKLKENDEIIQTIETNNKSELLMFSSRQNVYKIKCHDLPECKTSNIGEYLNNLLSMDNDERIVYITISNDYKGYMLFAFENGKIAKVDMSSYATKTMRKKLINAYSDKFPLVAALYIEGDTDIVLVRDTDKAMLLNTGLIPEKQTKSTGGVSVYTLKKNSKLTGMMNKDEFVSADIEYYRSNKIPATGHFINDGDKESNNFPKQLDLFN
ncbi:MAG: DNA gyrase subunit A [Clostridia bacterium]|nr:DNA gyrase subunit A [Clostridia bacterium]